MQRPLPRQHFFQHLKKRESIFLDAKCAFRHILVDVFGLNLLPLHTCYNPHNKNYMKSAEIHFNKSQNFTVISFERIVEMFVVVFAVECQLHPQSKWNRGNICLHIPLGLIVFHWHSNTLSAAWNIQIMCGVTHVSASHCIILCCCLWYGWFYVAMKH